MRVLLANPPWRRPWRRGVRAGSRWPFTMLVGLGADRHVPEYVPFPFFLAYSTSVLLERGIEALLVDAIAEGLDDRRFLARVEEAAPDLVVIESSTPTYSTDQAMARRFRRSFPGLRLAIAGAHASHFKEQILAETPEIDFVLVGEYELTVAELAERLASGASLTDVAGLVYRDGTAPRFTGRRPLIADLDSLPWPAYDQLPMYNYNDEFETLSRPNVQLWTSRGCPYKCIFCMWPQVMYGSHTYRARDPVKVVDEIEYLVDRYGFRGVYLDDDTWNLGKKRILEFCRELKERALGVPWAAMARADQVDAEMLEAMADAGMAGIKYGIESADADLLAASGKALDLERAVRGVQLTKEVGLKVHLTYTFGLPGETWETVEKTLAFAVAMGTDSAQFSITTPFPGTSYFDWLKERQFLLTEDWDRYDGNLHGVIRTEQLSEADLAEALSKANQLWRRERGCRE